jgi:lipopolysaccharide export system protein LptC
MSANQPDDPSIPDLPADDAGGRLRHLGDARRTATYAPAYTKFVRRLRVVLPIAGLLTIAVVALWPRIQAELNRPTETSQEEREARMVNGRFVGSDVHGRPYTVTYESARQPPGGGPIDMVNPIAELTLQNGRWVALRSDQGRYDQANGLLDLSGHVELFHDDGYRFATEAAHVEFSKNLIWGDRAVQGRGPKGEIFARGFRVINNGDAISFTGSARLLLRPDAAQMPQPGEAP